LLNILDNKKALVVKPRLIIFTGGGIVITVDRLGFCGLPIPHRSSTDVVSVRDGPTSCRPPAWRGFDSR